MSPLVVFFDESFEVPGASVETVSKAAHVAAGCRTRQSVELRSPQPASRSEMLGVHDDEYVDAVLSGLPRVLAESAGVGPWSTELRDSILASNGAFRDAAVEAWRSGTASGALSSGLHHARRRSGAGFCTFNGLALAALAVLAAGAASVGVLDVDAHFGGGTAELLGSDARVTLADVATDSFDRWPTEHPSRHYSCLVTDSGRYLDEVATAVSRVVDCDVVLYNAGMDSHEGCPVGGLGGVTSEVLAERERFVAHALAGRPVAFCLAGGYVGRNLDVEALTGLHLLTVDAFAACEPAVL